MTRRLVEQVLIHRRAAIVLLHALLIPLGYLAAYGLRFDFDIPPSHERIMWSTLPYLVVFRLFAFDRFGLFRGYWRHVGLRDLLALGTAVTMSSALTAGALLFVGELPKMPRSVLLLDWMLAIVVFGGIRFATRVARERQLPRVATQRTLVIGAGEAAERLLRQFLHDGTSMQFVGLVDDDPRTHGMSLHGVPVLGGIADLRHLCLLLRPNLLVIAIPSARGEQVKRIVEHCRETGVPFKICPSLQELLEGRATVGQLRNVEIEDLLGREPVRLDLRIFAREIAGRVVMVTGGAGSIGAELARQVGRFGPSTLVLVEQAESPLYFIHLELAQAYPDVRVIPVIADVADRARVEEVVATHAPAFVFHAAAYKHVPMMEANVVEAVRNNVFGTLNVAEAASRHGARRFVLISTDKAVNPSSVMGATKRIAERIVLGWPALRASSTDFRAVRFGNVLGSDGSVIPLFRRQLAAGGPLTVTHPEVCRYFMTIPEAVQLVLEAASLPEAAGRIAMLEMGEPVRIVELAEQLIRLSGLEPYRDMQIVFTGLRPGEKLYEELLSTVEATVPTGVEKIRVVQTDEADGPEIERRVHQLGLALRQDRETLLAMVQALVPEFRHRRDSAEAERMAAAERAARGIDVPVRIPIGARADGHDTPSRAADGALHARLTPMPSTAPA